jgi:hypothetical protein
MTVTIELTLEDARFLYQVYGPYVADANPELIGIGIEPNLLEGEEGIGNLAFEIEDDNDPTQVTATKDLLIGVIGQAITQLIGSLADDLDQADRMLQVAELKEMGLARGGLQVGSWDFGEPQGRTEFYEAIGKRANQLGRLAQAVTALTADHPTAE